MKIIVIGDNLVSDEGDIVATFNPALLPTRRETAEHLFDCFAVEEDTDMRDRCFEQQDRIAELEEELAEAGFRIFEQEASLRLLETRLSELSK